MKNLAYAIEWKLTELNLFKGATIQTKEDTLVLWKVNGMDQPDDKVLQQWCDEYDKWLQQQDQSDKAKMAALQAKLNLSDDEVETLKMLLGIK